MYPVRVESERLRLRELNGADVDAVLRIYGDPVATRHLSFEPRSRTQVESIVRRAEQAARIDPRVEYDLAVVRHVHEDLIGYARLAVEPHGAGQIGFALRPNQWGLGLGQEAVHLLMALGFDHLGLHRIWGARSPANTASKRVMSRLGMIEEGRIRDHVHVHGAWRDSIVHAILEDEWRATVRRSINT